MLQILKKPSPLSLSIIIGFFLCSILVGLFRASDFTGKDFLWRGVILSSQRGETYVHMDVSMEERHQKFWKFITTNSQVALFTLVVGTLFFVYPVFKISVFGFIIGVLYWHIGSIQVFMKLMLPHSLTEIPMALYYCAIAQSSGWKWLTATRGSRWTCFRLEFISNLKLWACVILPMVLFNAMLEAYVTNG